MPRKGSKKTDYRRVTFFMLLSLLVALGSGALLVEVSPSAQAQTAGTTINVFCMDYGKTFPTGQSIQANGTAPANIQGALSYALSKGYISSNPYEVQLAVWHLRDGQAYHDFENKGTTIAQEIVTNANTATTGSTTAPANLTISNIHEFTADTGFGSGTIQGSTNTNNIPVGILLPASNPSFQGLVAVVATANASTPTPAPTAAPTPSPAPTATAAPTATTAPTTTAGSMPSGSPSTGGGGSATDNNDIVRISLSVIGFILAGLLAYTGLSYLPRKRQR